MKFFFIITAIPLCFIALILLLTYPSFHRQMEVARHRLSSNSDILSTEIGSIEYAVLGEGLPVLLIHGAGGGYDQGFWTGKISLGTGYRFISVSRFGYLRSPLTARCVHRTSGLYVCEAAGSFKHPPRSGCRRFRRRSFRHAICRQLP